MQTPGNENIRRGEKLYARYCGTCHGMFGSKSLLPGLAGMRPEIGAIFTNIVLDGVFEAKGMPGFADLLDPEEVELIRQYLGASDKGKETRPAR